MALDGQISGASTRLSISDPVTGVIDLGDVLSFSFKDDTRVEPTILMNGRAILPRFVMWWTGTIEMLRTNPDFDVYYQLQASRYINGLNQVNANMHQTITEANGDVSQYQFNGTVFVMEDGGTFSGAELVRRRLSFWCHDWFKL